MKMSDLHVTIIKRYFSLDLNYIMLRTGVLSYELRIQFKNLLPYLTLQTLAAEIESASYNLGLHSSVHNRNNDIDRNPEQSFDLQNVKHQVLTLLMYQTWLNWQNHT